MLLLRRHAHSAATTDTHVYACAGLSLGDGKKTRESRSTPTLVGCSRARPWCNALALMQVQSLHGKQAVDVDCGFAHSVAILSGGLMVVWGSAVTGKLGLGPVTDEYECFCPIPTPLVRTYAHCNRN